MGQTTPRISRRHCSGIKPVCWPGCQYPARRHLFWYQACMLAWLSVSSTETPVLVSSLYASLAISIQNGDTVLVSGLCASLAVSIQHGDTCSGIRPVCWPGCQYPARRHLFWYQACMLVWLSPARRHLFWYQACVLVWLSVSSTETPVLVSSLCASLAVSIQHGDTCSGIKPVC